MSDTNYEQLYDHQPAITVELKHFARFDALLPFIDQYFTKLRYVCLAYEPTFGCVSPPKVEVVVDESWKYQLLSSDGVGRTLESFGFHVDDTRLGALFQVWPVTELLVRCPDLEKVPTGGGGGGGAAEWSGFRGRCLCELNEVKRLELRYCNKVQVQHFQQFMISNGEHLQHLVLKECAQLNGSDIVMRDIALHLEHLWHLELHFLDLCPPLGKLTELRELRVLHLTMASDCERLLEDLAVNDTLNELHVTDCLVDFSSPGFAGTEFFTHLRAVTLHGNVVGSRMLKRFANALHLEVMRFTYVAGMEGGLIEVVELAGHLVELDMYCTDWPSTDTMQRIVNVLEMKRSRREASTTSGWIPLHITMTLEIYDEKDRSRWEEVVQELRGISERNAHLIRIDIV